MLIDRGSYIEKIVPLLNKPLTKVISGIRRLGEKELTSA